MEENEELRLEDAKWFAEELGKLTRDDQGRVFAAETTDSLRQVYGGDADRLWRGRESWKIESSLGHHIDIPEPRTVHLENTENPKPENVSSTAKVTAGTAIIGSAIGADRIINRDYYKFKKEREKYVKEQVEKWKENQDETFAKSEEGAQNRAVNEYNDKKLADEPEKFQKWAKKHRDSDLEKAIKRKEILEKENPKRDKKELDEFLKEHDVKNPEKTHRNEDEMSAEQVEERLKTASNSADEKPTPESEADRLGRLQDEVAELKKEENKDKLILPDKPRSTETKNATQDLPKLPKNEIVQTAQQHISPASVRHLPPPSPSSSFSQNPRRAPYLMRRGQRARRRYGPGGFLKGIGKNAAKKGATRTAGWAASWLAANPMMLAALIGLVVIFAGFILIIGTIKNACDNFWDDPLGNATYAFIGTVTGICSASPDGITVIVPPNPKGVTTVKDGPERANNGEDLKYTLTISYDPSVIGGITSEQFTSLSVFDIPLYEYELVSTTGTSTPGTGSDDRKYIRWVIADNPDCTDDYYCIFELVVHPNQGNFIAKNVIYASLDYKEIEIIASENALENAPTINSGPGVKTCGTRSENDIWYGADCLPTDKTCDGRWSDQMYGGNGKIGTKNIVEEHIREERLQGSAGDGYNFGDPLCSFKAAKVDAVIDSLVEAGVENKARGEFWKDIAYCEGTPNSFGAQALDPDDDRPMGPAGYFQMNIGTPIVFKAWQEDKPIRGDVPWQRQIQNAINHNNSQSKDFFFWGGAYCLCAYPGYKDKGYCQDLIDAGRTRPVGSCNDNCIERGERGPAL